MSNENDQIPKADHDRILRVTDMEDANILRNGLPPPPVPQRLRDMLKEYPGHIERLQEVLNGVVERPSPGTPPFEVAIWALESRLSAFIREARNELKAAQANGGAETIAPADTKKSLMLQARSSNGGMKGLHELWDYFERHKDALR